METQNITLRKLTWKSKWDFTTKYQGLTIERVFELKPSSVWWLYCKYEKISFVDEILDKLSELFPLERIQKPGIDPNQIDNYFSNHGYDKRSFEELKKLITFKKMNNLPIHQKLFEEFYKKRSMVRDVNVKTNLSLSKKELQGLNQGHTS